MADQCTETYAEITEVSSLIMRDIKELQLYYTAITKIRQILEEVCSPFEYKCTGFESWPTPNPYYCRTPKYMFLETAIWKDGKEEIVLLYTPFGQVPLLSGGWCNEILKISKKFLKSMDWKLIDVTKTIKVYNYIQEDDKKFGPFPLKKEQWKGSGTPTKLYLISRVGEIDFISNKDNVELFFFSTLVLKHGQYEKDNEQFKQLSQNTNKF